MNFLKCYKKSNNGTSIAEMFKRNFRLVPMEGTLHISINQNTNVWFVWPNVCWMQWHHKHQKKGNKTASILHELWHNCFNELCNFDMFGKLREKITQEIFFFRNCSCLKSCFKTSMILSRNSNTKQQKLFQKIVWMINRKCLQ